jgi:hypothetical protein
MEPKDDEEKQKSFVICNKDHFSFFLSLHHINLYVMKGERSNVTLKPFHMTTTLFLHRMFTNIFISSKSIYKEIRNIKIN